MSAELDGVHFVPVRRPGKPLRWYVYAWRGGPAIAKGIVSPTRPRLGKAELAALAAALGDRTAPQDAQLLSGMIRRWRGPVGGAGDLNRCSPEWKALEQGTRKTWGSQLDAIEAKWGKTPIAVWNDPRMVTKVIAWRDSRAETPRAADIGVQVLRELLGFGRLRAEVLINVADKIPTIYRGADRSEILWTEEDIDRFAFYAGAEDMEHVVDGLDLAIVTGLRRQDLVTVADGNVWEYAVVKRALKKSRRKRRHVTMPRIPELDLVLARLRRRYRAPGVSTLLVNSRGEPWTGDGFGGSFNRIRDLAGIVHTDPETGEQRKKHLHDVRGTFATKLILAGQASGQPLTDEEVGDMMGWSAEHVAQIRRVYVDQARVVVAIGERIRGRV
jgi:hypothetical protein